MNTVGEPFPVGLVGEGVTPSLTTPLHELDAHHQPFSTTPPPRFGAINLTDADPFPTA